MAKEDKTTQTEMKTENKKEEETTDSTKVQIVKSNSKFGQWLEQPYQAFYRQSDGLKRSLPINNYHVMGEIVSWCFIAFLLGVTFSMLTVLSAIQYANSKVICQSLTPSNLNFNDFDQKNSTCEYFDPVSHKLVTLKVVFDNARDAYTLGDAR